MKKFFTALAAITATLTLALTFAACGGGNIEVASVTLNKTEITLEEGGEGTLTATVNPENATDKTVSWTSSNEAASTVLNGKVKAVKEGTATVTAKAGAKTAECKVTVTKPAPVELTKEQIKKAFENTINAENLTISLYPVDNTVRIDGKNKIMYMNTSDDYTVVADGEGENFVIKEYRVPLPSEKPPYETSNSVTTECEQIIGKKITSFAELAVAYIYNFSHINIIKDMEFTYNAEDNCYSTQVTGGGWCKCYFEGNGNDARLTKFSMGPEGMEATTEFRFYDYGTTVCPELTSEHVLVYTSK